VQPNTTGFVRRSWIVSKRGLPSSLKMRHDEHYVDALTNSAGEPIGRMIPIDQIDPNPDQPRQVMGDLSELMASITEKGIIEPLIVRQRGGRYQIVAGERRYQASVQVGIRELPAVIRDVDDNEIVEVADGQIEDVCH
jgi:ParB family transcriptional regulator, chromosome partitioning protein